VAELNLTPKIDDIPPPLEITRTSYRRWLEAIGSKMSAFFDDLFTWHEHQLVSPLPGKVLSDPEKLYVDVQTALTQTRAHEASGDVTKLTTVGFDSYGLLTVSPSVALETILFYSGKPVGKPWGQTYPVNPVFSCSCCSIQEKWGERDYVSSASYTRGGFAFDINDDYTILVRGNSSSGYTVFRNYLKPTESKRTPTEAHFAIAMFKPAPDGTVEFRHALRRNGQNYLLEFNRNKYGFNQEQAREIEKAVAKSMEELKNTGKITERPC
jgi:hypothetical protein